MLHVVLIMHSILVLLHGGNDVSEITQLQRHFGWNAPIIGAPFFVGTDTTFWRENQRMYKGHRFETQYDAACL